MTEKDMKITTIPKMESLAKTLQTANTDFYKPVPFWSINAKLEKAEIIRQVKEMHAHGLGGFIFHARTGLVTEYLSEEWFEMVTASLDTAKELGMRVWIYDENGWPSGFVGGKLLANMDHRARYLRYAVLDEYDENAYAVYEYNEQTGAKLLKKGEKAQGKYHTVYMEYSNAYTDILNPELTSVFINETYELYYDRYKDRFGKELIGFFTDEPQYFRWQTPISKLTETEYKKRYGKDLKEQGLIYLFLQDEKGYKFRVEYYNLMNQLYCENFYVPIYNWCEAHGCLFTGHSVEETSLVSNMWGGADCAPSYMYEHIPGIDNLQKGCTAEISAKSIGSVSAQVGKKFVLTETFGVSGYSTTPKQLRIIADKQYVYGVNLMVQHLYPYSLAGQGKIDCPPAFGRNMPWLAGYPTFNKYYEKLGYFVANSEEIAPVAVVTPMESVYLDYIRLAEDQARANVDAPFAETVDSLRKAGIAYQFVNEKVLEKIGCVKDGKLIVGEKSYGAIVVGNCREIKSNTLALLQKATAGGAKLYISGGVPTFVDGEKAEVTLVSNCEIDDLPRPVAFTSNKTVSYTYRRIGGKNCLFFVNENDEPALITTEKPFSVVDITNLVGYRAQTTHIVPAQSSLVLEEDGAYDKALPTFTQSVSVKPTLQGSDANNLTIEKVTVRTGSGEELTGYVYGVFETLAKRDVAGEIHVQFRFESDIERPIKITREKQNVYNVRYNGKELGFAQAEEDVNFEVAECVAKAGENVYEYDVDYDLLKGASKTLYDTTIPESILNCLTYSTGMEQIYIGGDFDVEGYKLISKKSKVAGDLTKQGYDNFYGAVRYGITLPEGVKNAFIKPVGTYSRCVITVDGKPYEVILTEGVYVENIQNREVEIECYSTSRNRIGPFHLMSEVDDGISPDAFTLRNTWKDEKTSSWYSEERRLVPFGLDEVVVEA